MDTSYSQGKNPVVWGVQAGMIPWAIVHALRRHGGMAEDLVILEIVADEENLKRFKGGLWYSARSWPPDRILEVNTFAEYVASTTGAGA